LLSMRRLCHRILPLPIGQSLPITLNIPPLFADPSQSEARSKAPAPLANKRSNTRRRSSYRGVLCRDGEHSVLASSCDAAYWWSSQGALFTEPTMVSCCGAADGRWSAIARAPIFLPQRPRISRSRCRGVAG